MSTPTLRDHVARIASALFAGKTASIDLFRRSLARSIDVTPEQRELLASLEVLERLRARLASTLDECERSGAVSVATLCRDLIRDPLSTFLPVQRWGVCALTGRTVNAQLKVCANDSETAVNAHFGPFLRSVWCLSHCELIESSRHDCADGEDSPDVGLDELTASYLQAFEHITVTLDQTAAALAKRRCAAE